MKIEQKPSFFKDFKKLHKSQQQKLEEEILKIANNPSLGQAKLGDLSGVRVHKFQLSNHLTLMAYFYEEAGEVITLLKFGSHENFYRDLKASYK